MMVVLDDGILVDVVFAGSKNSFWTLMIHILTRNKPFLILDISLVFEESS